MKGSTSVAVGLALAIGLLADGRPAGAVMAAHEAITVQLGDTIMPRFSIRTDTVLAVVGTNVVAKRCGTGRIFLRTTRAARTLSADTITVSVECIATLEVCLFPDTAILNRYHFRGDTAADPKLLKCPSPQRTPTNQPE